MFLIKIYNLDGFCGTRADHTEVSNLATDGLDGWIQVAIEVFLHTQSKFDIPILNDSLGEDQNLKEFCDAPTWPNERFVPGHKSSGRKN